MHRKPRIRDLLADLIACLCLFALPILLLFISHGFGL